MKKKLVITNVPSRYPINSTVLYSFLLYYFNVDGLYWGIFVTLFSIYWILVFIVKFNEVNIDLNENENLSSSNFKEKIQNMIKEIENNENRKHTRK